MIDQIRWTLLSFFLALALSNFVGAAYSSSGRVMVRDDHGMLDLSFSDHDRQLIREYYGERSRHKQLPPGLAKKTHWPPGMKKKCERHDRLPPRFMYQRSAYHRLPRELEHRLSSLPDGYLRVEIGGSVVLFNERTRVIFDVIHGFD